MIDEELLIASYFDQLWLSKDTGYQGCRPQGVRFLEPFKAFRNRPVSDIEKKMNCWISSAPLVVEDTVGGMKRLCVASEGLRPFIANKADQTTSTAVDLHNPRVRYHKGSYLLEAFYVHANLYFPFTRV
jgi:hypothetical protein